MSRSPIWVYCDGKSLRPADPYAAEQIQKLHEELPQGEFFARLSRITATGRDERTGLFGLWWAGCQLFADNTENRAWDTGRKVSDQILRGLGFVRPRYRADKTMEMIPVSISTENMDDGEFSTLLERAQAFMVERWDWDPFESWKDEQTAKKALEDQRKRRRA